MSLSIRSRTSYVRSRRKQIAKSRLCRAVQSAFEGLEGRILFATVSWDGPASGDWNTEANWSNDQLPQSGDDVVINSSPSITHSTGTHTIRSLTLSNGTLALTGGSIAVTNGASTGGTFNISSGATFSISGTDGFTLNNVLNNSGTINYSTTGQFNLNSRLNNNAGGVFDLKSDADIIGNNEIFNIGTFRKSAGTDVSRIAASTVDLYFHHQGGTVDAQTGTILIDLARGDNTGATWNASTGAKVQLTGNGFNQYGGNYGGTGGGMVELASGQFNFYGGSTPIGFNFAAGLLHWTGGNFATAGVTRPVNNTGTITISGSNSKLLQGLVVNTSTGTIIHTGTGNLSMNGGNMLLNQAGGVYDFQSDADVTGFGEIKNEGTIKKTGGTDISQIGSGNNDMYLFHQGGTVDAQTGTLFLNNLRGDSTGATWNASENATLRIQANQDGFNSYSGTYAGSGAGRVELSAGRFFATNPGATFNFPTGLFHWTGGTISSSGASGPFKNTGFITLSGSNDKSLVSLLVNEGTIKQTGAGNLVLSGSGRLDNQSGGIYDFQSDADITGSGEIRNSATIKKTAGTDTSQIGAGNNDFYFYHLGGTVDAQSGTIFLNNLRGDSTGATWKASENALLRIQANNDNFNTYSGTYTGSGAGKVELSGGSFFAVNPGATFNFPAGLFHWTGGTINTQGAAGPFKNKGFITLSGSNNKTLVNLFINEGTIRQVGTGNLMLSGSGRVDNQSTGVYDIQSDAGIGGNGTFNNTGILRKSDGTGTSSIARDVNNGFYFQHLGGTVDVQKGTLKFDELRGDSTGGTWNVATGAKMELVPESNGFNRFGGTYTGSGGGTVELSGGSLVANSPGMTLNFPTGYFQWTGGGMFSGSGSPITNSGFITMAGGNDKSFAGYFTNDGTITHGGAGHFQVGGSTSFTNSSTGLYNFTGNGSLLKGNFGAGFISFITNNGTFRKSGGTGTSQIGIVLDIGATGILNAQTGILNPTGGGSSTSAGATLNASTDAIIRIGGSNNFSMGGTLTGSGGGLVQIAGPFIDSGSGVTLNFPTGMLQWLASPLGSALLGSITNQGEMSIVGEATDGLFMRAGLTNNGTIIQKWAGSITVNANSSFFNNGVWDIQSDGDLLVPTDGSVGTVPFNNTGTLRKSTGTGTSRFGHSGASNAMRLNNTGTVEAKSGTLAFEDVVTQQSGSTLTAGTWKVGPNSTLAFPASVSFTTNNANVTLDGIGSVFAAINALATIGSTGSFSLLNDRDFTRTGNLTNNGTLTLGASSVLTVTGTYTQGATGTVVVQVGGSPASGLFGSMNVGTTGTLAGTLTATVVNGFGPSTGQVYTIITASPLNGDFTTFNAPASLTPTKVGNTYTLNGVGSPADLEVDSVTTPANGHPGDVVSFSYTIKNIGGNNAVGSWTDSLYLSKDGVLSNDDLLIGRTTHVGGLAASGSYVGGLTAPLPGALEGSYRVIVITDSGGDVADTDRANNDGASGTFSLTFNTIPTNATTPGTIKDGQDIYYKLNLQAGDDVVLTGNFAVAREAEFYVRFNAVPDRTNFDLASTNITQTTRQLQFHASQSGQYFILLHGRDGAGAGQSFSITPTLITFGVSWVSPNHGSNNGSTTTVIKGSKFTPETVVALVSGGTTRNATKIQFVDSHTLFATFNLSGLNTGTYNIRATDDSDVATLANAFSVNSAAAGHLSYNISSPQFVRVGRGGTVILDYENDGEADLPAPYFVVSSNNARMRLEEQTGFMDDQLELLAINRNGAAGVLPPGARGQIKIFFEPKVVGQHIKIKFTAQLIKSNESIDWTKVKNDLRPANEPADAWDAIFANFLGQMGNTTGQYFNVIRDNASYLSQLGTYTADPQKLLSYELDQAGGFGTIDKHFAISALGRGQFDPFNLAAIIDTAGNFMIPAGQYLRPFLRQSNGNYLPAPGDFAKLTKLSSGAYELREKSGLVTAFHADGKINYIQNPSGERLTYNYTSGRVSSVSNTNGDVTTIGYNGQGRMSTVTDPVGRVTTYGYDASGQHLTSITTPRGTMSMTYVGGAGPAQHAIESITYADNTHQFFEYDAQGRLKKTTRDGGAQPVTITYDSVGNATMTDAQGHVTRVFNNNLAQLAAVQNPLGDVTALSYGANGLPSGIDLSPGVSQTLSYDSQGNVEQVFDAAGKAISFTSHPTFNDPLTLTDALGNTMVLGYDAQGHLTTLTDPAGKIETTRYDAQGRLIGVETAGGITAIITYDSKNLVKRREFSDGSFIDYTYDGHRNLLTATDAGGTTTFTYDSADRMTSATYPNGLSLTYTYNALGQRATMTDQTGFVTRYGYDALGRLQTLKDTANNTIATYTYDTIGRLDRVDRANGSFTTYGYDDASQITSIVNFASAGNINSQFAYTYDAQGRRTSQATAAGETTYAYDLRGQLVQVNLPGGRTIIYAYDAVGNRTSITDSGVPTTYTVNNLNQYTAVGAVTYNYDDDGNLISRTDAGGTTTYTYDVRGQLTQVASPTDTYVYSYDALRNRVAVTHNGTTTRNLIDPAGLGDVVGQFDTGGTVLSHFTYGLGLTSSVNGAGASSFYEFDGSGNTTGLTGAAGAIINAYAYLPYGELLASSGAAANPFTFGGQMGVVDDGNGLHYMRNRYYTADEGRFTQRDPVRLLGGDVNFYRYAKNNPVNMADPSGLEPATVSVGTAVSYSTLQAARALGAEIIANIGGAGASSALGGGSVLAGETLTAGGIILSNPAGGATGTLAANAFNAHFVGDAVLATNSGVAGTSSLTAGLGGTGGYMTTGGVSTSLVAEGGGTAAYSGAMGIGGAGGGTATGATATGTTLGAGSIAGIGIVFTGMTMGIAYTYAHRDDGLPTDVQNIINDDKFQQLQKKPLVKELIERLRAQGIEPTPAVIEEFMKLEAEKERITESDQVNSNDPNDIVGPAGYGSQFHLDNGVLLPYQINFQNKPDATAPAAVVVITQTLDSDLDLTTFALGNMGFGSTVVPVGSGLQAFSTQVLLSPGLRVDITAELNLATRVVTWTFKSIDPATGDEPADPFVGFLPPDVNASEGQGFVSYSVRAKSALTTGTKIDAEASIVFDSNAAIATPAIFSTIDQNGPASQVNTLPTTIGGTNINVSWSGVDDAGGPTGAGIATFDIFVSVNGGAYSLWKDDTAATNDVYTGVVGNTYAFYSVATDGVGHEEAAPAGADTQTTLVALPEIDITDDSGNSTDKSVTLADTQVGQTSATKVFTITNSGAQALNISNFLKGGSHPGDFIVTVKDNTGAVVSSTSFSIPAGLSYTITVAFKPTAAAGRSATITFNTNDTDDSEGSITLTINGTGTQSSQPATTTYLSDMNPTFAANGWGPYQRDKSNGETGANDGRTITLNGKTYTKGLGVHAGSELRYLLGGQYTRFIADVGMDDEAGTNGNVIFQVWADGVKLFDSSVMTGNTATKHVDVDVSGRNELRLLVLANGSNVWDHADWADARVIKNAVPPTQPDPFVYLSDQTPTFATNGFGTFEKDRSNGHQLPNDGNTITLAGKTYAKGIGVHAGSELRYALNANYTRFTADVGLDDETGSNGNAIFQVWADGVKLFDSGAMTGNSATQHVDIDLTGRRELRLLVLANGSNVWDHGDWADAKLYTESVPPVLPERYLSDETPTFASNGFGTFEKDRSNGHQLPNDGNTITLNGKTYTKGIGVHAGSELRYALGGQYTRFTADVGIDDETGSNGNAIFQVWADGIKLFDSGAMTGNSATQHVDVNITGRNELRLLLLANGSNTWDHGDWADAKLFRPS